MNFTDRIMIASKTTSDGVFSQIGYTDINDQLINEIANNRK